MTTPPEFNVFPAEDSSNSLYSQFAENLVSNSQNQNEEELDKIYKNPNIGVWEGTITTYRADKSSFVESVKANIYRNKYSLIITFQNENNTIFSPIICVGNVDVNNYFKNKFFYNISITGIKFLLDGFINPGTGQLNLRGNVTGRSSAGIGRIGYTLNIELNYKIFGTPLNLPPFNNLPSNYGDFDDIFINDLQAKIAPQGLALLKTFIKNRDEGLLLDYFNVGDTQLLYYYIYNYPLLIGQLTFSNPPVMVHPGIPLLAPAFIQFANNAFEPGTPLINEPYQPVNQIYYLNEQITPDFNRIVSPNFNTIYSSTYINLGIVDSINTTANSLTMKGNNIIHYKVPGIPQLKDGTSASTGAALIVERYFALQIIDEYSQSLCTVSKSTGNDNAVNNLNKLSYNSVTSSPTHDLVVVIVNENWNSLTTSEKMATDPNHTIWDSFNWNNPVNFSTTTPDGPSKINEVDNMDGTYTLYTKLTIPSNFCWILFRVFTPNNSDDILFQDLKTQVFENQVLTTFSNNNKDYVGNNPADPIEVNNEVVNTFKTIWDNVTPGISPAKALLEGVNDLTTYLNLANIPIRNGAIVAPFSNRYVEFLANNSYNINANGTFGVGITDFADSNTDKYYKLLGENAVSQIFDGSKILSISDILTFGTVLFNESTQFTSLGKSIGSISNDYITRTVVANTGFGANPLFESAYFGAILGFSNSNNYTQRFNLSNTPKIKNHKGGFWSITVYNSENDQAINNPLGVYSIDSFLVEKKVKYPNNLTINYRKVLATTDLIENYDVTETSLINFPIGDVINPGNPINLKFILRLYLPDDSIIFDESNYVATIPAIEIANI